MNDSTYTDNIVRGRLWDPPYRFIILQVAKPPTKLTLLSYVALDASDAYTVLSEFRQKNILSFLYDYVLVDAFHRDAEEFCKKAFEKTLDESAKRIFK